VASALVHQAEELAAARRRREAVERLEEAEGLLDGLDAVPLLRRAHQLRSAMGHPAAPVQDQRDPASVDPLRALGITTRERQVLDLLVLGRTNRQIGRALGTTERTAGTHVSNLLRKLGVTSRVEAVSLAHRLRASAGQRPRS
jgi:DNA-binding NarL/FixJ family response regulator